LKPIRLSKIWSVARSDGPSETSDGSINVGSASVPNTIVVLAVRPPWAVATSAEVASATATTTPILNALDLTLHSFSVGRPEVLRGGGEKRRATLGPPFFSEIGTNFFGYAAT
jgi:hypothetical protein